MSSNNGMQAISIFNGLSTDKATDLRHSAKALPSLPAEVHNLIISYAVLPQPICPKYLFSDCLDPWICTYGISGHPSFPERSSPVIPPLNIILVSKSFFHKSCEVFYSRHAFILNLEEPALLLRALIKNQDAEESGNVVIRDVVASFLDSVQQNGDARLYGFLDDERSTSSSTQTPFDEGSVTSSGSECIKPHPQSVTHQPQDLIHFKSYLSHIHNLHIFWKNSWTAIYPDFDHINWSQLPHLETLHIRTRQHFHTDPMLREAQLTAKKMGNTKLRKLVFVLCRCYCSVTSGDWRNDLRNCFLSVMKVDGEMEMWDDPHQMFA